MIIGVPLKPYTIPDIYIFIIFKFFTREKFSLKKKFAPNSIKVHTSRHKSFFFLNSPLLFPSSIILIFISVFLFSNRFASFFRSLPPYSIPKLFYFSSVPKRCVFASILPVCSIFFPFRIGKSLRSEEEEEVEDVQRLRLFCLLLLRACMYMLASSSPLHGVFFFSSLFPFPFLFFAANAVYFFPFPTKNGN